nr:hypothetical protein [Paenibacillus xylanexedens]
MEIAARARLRPNKDEDLIRVWKNLPPHEDKSDIVRKALRLLFFGGESYSINDYSFSLEGQSEVKPEADHNDNEQEEDFEIYDEKLDELLGSF